MVDRSLANLIQKQKGKAKLYKIMNGKKEITTKTDGLFKKNHETILQNSKQF